MNGIELDNYNGPLRPGFKLRLPGMSNSYTIHHTAGPIVVFTGGDVAHRGHIGHWMIVETDAITFI